MLKLNDIVIDTDSTVFDVRDGSLSVDSLYNREPFTETYNIFSKEDTRRLLDFLLVELGFKQEAKHTAEPMWVDVGAADLQATVDELTLDVRALQERVNLLESAVNPGPDEDETLIEWNSDTKYGLPTGTRVRFRDEVYILVDSGTDDGKPARSYHQPGACQCWELSE